MHNAQLEGSITGVLSALFKIEVTTNDFTLRQAHKSTGRGDISLTCFALAKRIGKNPSQVAKEIATELEEQTFILVVEAVGGYVNMTLPADTLFKDACDAIRNKCAKTGDDRIMIEYLSPNTNKPLHLGHVRNGVLGASISNMLEAVGHKVVRAILINDRGVHICQSMLAWERFFSGQTPTSADRKPDHFVGDCYVRYHKELQSDPSLEAAVTKMLQLWEEGDESVRKTWTTMNNWVYDGFDQTCERFGFTFVARYLESKTYMLGKDIVASGLSAGVFEKTPDGSIVFRLAKAEFGLLPDATERVASVLRSDGTSVYLTQDIGTAIVKVKEYDLNRSVYVVACEQQHHFKVLFEILRSLGYEWASKCHHLSYEMVKLPDGRMKSREGTVVDADNLADHMAGLAKEELRKRDVGLNLNEDEIQRRANIIGLAAIKFYLLRINPQREILFDLKRSLSMAGDTGPYCLYTYARIQGVLRTSSVTDSEVDFSVLGSVEERNLAMQLLGLPNHIESAASQYNPALLANHILAIIKGFNSFYAQHRIATEQDPGIRNARIALTRSTGEAIQWGLSLLGIDILDEM